MKKSDIPSSLSLTKKPFMKSRGLKIQGAGFGKKQIKTLHPPTLRIVRGRGKRRRTGGALGLLAATVAAPLLLGLLGKNNALNGINWW